MQAQPENPAVLPPARSVDPVQKARDKREFWIGFIIWYVFNILAGGVQILLYWLLTTYNPGPYTNSATGWATNLVGLLGCLVFLINLVVITVLAFRRKQMALGMLVAFASAIAISLVLGIIASVACFVIIINAYSA